MQQNFGVFLFRNTICRTHPKYFCFCVRNFFQRLRTCSLPNLRMLFETVPAGNVENSAVEPGDDEEDEEGVDEENVDEQEAEDDEEELDEEEVDEDEEDEELNVGR